MPTPPLTEADARKAVAALEEAFAKGHRKGMNPSATKVAADALGIPTNTLYSRIRIARENFGLEAQHPDGPVGEIPEAAPAEIHDSRFWKAKAAAAEKQLGEAARVVEEIARARSVPFRVPQWRAVKNKGRGNAVVAGLLSDLHNGEVVQPGEVAGCNEYNPEICERRVKRFISAVCEVGARWTSDTTCDGAILTVNGDLISGDIHEELVRTNALTSLEQVSDTARIIAGALTMLLDAYPKVHVVGTPGNHGRTTKKSTAKLYAALSYDTLIMSSVAEKFEGDKRVTFQIGARDVSTPVLGQTIFTTHGDKIGTGGGQGFAGPMLPIIRGCKKIVEQQSSIGQPPTVIQVSHYHKTGNPYLGSIPIFANGSVVGYSEYAGDIRAAVEPPQQWMYLVHSKWGVRERLAVQLEDPS